MTKIVCETAALADAINKAARIAPTKGSAWDKAHGVLLEVKPDKPGLRIKSTNLEISYLQRVHMIDAEGDDATWRLPSDLLSGILSALPLGAGQNVTLYDNGADVLVEAGKTVATLRSTDANDFPLVKAFDPDGMKTVTGLPERIKQVSWATAPADPVFSGVYIDGKTIKGCDRYVLVDVPCEVPVDEPVLASLAVASSVFKNVGDVKLRATETHLELMPDDDTQITALLLAGKYPQVGNIKRDKFQGSFKIRGEAFANAVDRMLVLARGERYPKLQLKVAKGELHMTLAVPNVGGIKDVIDVDGSDTKGFEFWCSPKLPLQACQMSGRELVSWHYGGTMQGAVDSSASVPSESLPSKITDDAGFECWLMPIIPTAAEKAAVGDEKKEEKDDVQPQPE